MVTDLRSDSRCRECSIRIWFEIDVKNLSWLALLIGSCTWQHLDCSCLFRVSLPLGWRRLESKSWSNIVETALERGRRPTAFRTTMCTTISATRTKAWTWTDLFWEAARIPLIPVVRAVGVPWPKQVNYWARSKILIHQKQIHNSMMSCVDLSECIWNVDNLKLDSKCCRSQEWESCDRTNHELTIHSQWWVFPSDQKLDVRRCLHQRGSASSHPHYRRCRHSR